MFKLQKLEITGFKSFADYTEIIFTGDGITAVVGPNGCGKSNISEAISWVLGEQSAKNLRGAEMRDVIFQGAKHRQPSGMAEVVLHFIRDEEALFTTNAAENSEFDSAFDELENRSGEIQIFDEFAADNYAEDNADNPPANGNSRHENGNNNSYKDTSNQVQVSPVKATSSKIVRRKRWQSSRFALEFAPGETVSITRRLYRSGDSEYLLNGKTCRLRDIQDLFSGTGLSGAHYAIIEQGRIGQILSAKPSDRRALIEEAAGITKFRVRQRAAESRLESAKSNLRRLSDIVTEVEKQVNALRRQASKTSRYKLLREEWRELLQQVFITEGNEFTATLENLQTEKVFVTKNEQNALQQIELNEKLFREATQKARSAETELAELREKIAERALARERQQSEIKYKTQQLHNLSGSLISLENEIKNGRQKLKVADEDVKRLREKQLQFENSEKTDSLLKIAEENYRQKLAEIRSIETEIEKVRSELMRHTTAVERFREVLRQLDNAIVKFNDREATLKKETARAAQTHGESVTESQSLTNKINLTREELNQLRQTQFSQKQTVKLKTETLQNAEKSWQKRREELARNKQRLATLREVEAKKTLYAPAVQKLIAAQDKLKIKFYGTLADKLIVKPEFETAVEAVFGDYLEAVLVDSVEAVKAVLNWLESNKIGRVKLVVWQDGKDFIPRELPKTAKNIGDWLETTAEFADFLERFFPVQMQTCVLENWAETRCFVNLNGVTREGDLVQEGVIFTIGKHSANTQNNSLLAFKRELREFDAGLLKLNNEAQAAENEVKIDRAALAEAVQNVSVISDKITAAERELMTYELKLQSLTQEIERATRHLRVVENERQQLEAELHDVNSRRQKAEADSQIAEAERLASAAKLENLLAALTKLRRQTETENARLGAQRAEAAATNERRRSIINALRRAEIEQNELNNNLIRRNKATAEITAEKEALNSALIELEKVFVTSNDTKIQEDQELSLATQNLHEIREKADYLSSEMNRLNQSATQIRDSRARLEVSEAALSTRLENLQNHCYQELNISLSSLMSTAPLSAQTNLRENRLELNRLREKLDNFGAVNMLALDELSIAEERMLFLTDQRQDIIESIALAGEALREIQNRSRERFQNAFTAINRYFAEFFQQIFGGGRSEMSILEAGDILEAGIEIVAQPPGKRLQNILLLSGGEKAMTAIALILAIFKYRPSPFCLLDEVDAPLDEANVGRFVQQIQAMSEKTQFIIITHNKRTMEAARALYGVTMEEAGISKIVSVKFE